MGPFMAADDLPSEDLERSQYELHENDPQDPHYRRFVGQLVGPLAERLRDGAEGLDYGCGRGPAGAAMLSEAGFDITLYDPFYAPNPSALERDYDFIFCCEVAEHFHFPAGEFARVDSLLRPGGSLAVMTGSSIPTSILSAGVIDATPPTSLSTSPIRCSRLHSVTAGRSPFLRAMSCCFARAHNPPSATLPHALRQ